MIYEWVKIHFLMNLFYGLLRFEIEPIYSIFCHLLWNNLGDIPRQIEMLPVRHTWLSVQTPVSHDKNQGHDQGQRLSDVYDQYEFSEVLNNHFST